MKKDVSEGAIMNPHLTDSLRTRALRLHKIIFGVLILSLSVSAYAVPITGEIGMGGSFVAVDSGWNATGTATATGVDFDPNLFLVNSATGSFTGVSSVGSITDFQFDPTLGVNDGSNGVTAVSSIVDFWTIDGFSFELTSVSKGITNNPNNFLILEGTGLMTAGGFDDTLGSWSFTGDTTNSGTFSWSAGSAAVSAPGSMVLLSIGLFGILGRKYVWRS